MTSEESDVRIPVSEAAEGGGDLREQVRRIVVDALLKRHADPAAIKEVMKATVEGLGDGLRPQGANAGESLKAAMGGMDEALGKTLLAMKMAMDESWQAGRRFAEDDLKQAYEAIRGLDDDLVATLKQTGERSQGVLKEEFARLYEHLGRSGMDTTAQTRSVLETLTRQMSAIAADSSKEAVRSAQLAGERFGAVTSGILRGLADTLDKRDGA
jgi:predicted component of type VI protein secretion system